MTLTKNPLALLQEEKTEPRPQSLTCIVASTPREFDQVNSLWREVYVDEMGWLTPKTEYLFDDSYHPHSVYLLASVDGKAVGTMRLVFDSEIGLPLEKFFPLGFMKKSTQKLVEAQRLMVSSSFRQRKKISGAPFGVSASLIKAGFHCCFLREVSHIFVDAFISTPTTPIKTFKALGFEQIGCPFIDADLCDPSKSVAMAIDIIQLLSKAYRTRSRLFSYLLEFDSSFEIQRIAQ